MPVYDAEDIVDLKNRKKRRKRLIKLSVALLLICIAAGMYFTRDTWLGRLRGIGKQYKTIVNSGQLATGNFPIELGSGYNYQMDFSSKKLMVLSDNYLYIYNTKGSLLKKRQHPYTNSILRAGDGRALVYESGGYEFSVEDEDEVIYTKKFEQNVLFARISSDGYVAVVTTEENYSCKLTVYNRKGDVIYERKCMDMVSDVSFKGGSSGCVLSYIKVENGSNVTIVQALDFRESSEKWSSPGLSTFGLEIFSTGSGAFVYGLDSCGYIDKNGQISSYYKYDGDLVAGDSDSGKAAVIVNNDDIRKYMAVLFTGEGSEPLILQLDSPTVDVAVSKGLAYILCQDGVHAYDFSGSLRSTAKVNDSYTGFVRSSDHVFLKGFNRIDRIDYDT